MKEEQAARGIGNSSAATLLTLCQRSAHTHSVENRSTLTLPNVSLRKSLTQSNSASFGDHWLKVNTLIGFHSFLSVWAIQKTWTVALHASPTTKWNAKLWHLTAWKSSWLEGNYHDHYALFINSKISRFICVMKLAINMQSREQNTNKAEEVSFWWLPYLGC